MEPASRAISIVNGSGRRVRHEPLRRAITAALQRHGLEGREVSLLLTGDDEIADLNREFRQLDEPTDVLTFPAGDFPGAPLGDIAISVPYAERQAKARGVSLTQELAYLAIHGSLHLAGFDDESEQERAEMVREMNVVAREMGLKADEEWHSLLHAEAQQ